MPARYLCVAEKPSIAKSITQILSGGQFTTRGSTVAWIKNFEFQYRMPPGNTWVDFVVTAVAGHLTSTDFTDANRKWHTCDPFDLFDCPLRTIVTDDPSHKGIARNLSTEARRATHLMIWTDCDREGEHIGSEIAEVCRKVKPNIIVQRARFSAIIANQIHNACRNPVPLDMRQAQAVAARIELDLRIGAALTRFQTTSLQARFANDLSDKVISYGTCQYPTLGFVVDQYERRANFVSEQFWFIFMSFTRGTTNVTFNWARNRIFDELAVEAIFAMCEADGEAVVTEYGTKPTSKWKPLPLTTVELQKSGSRLLHMSPKRILDTSEGLYQRGLLSYPRTETDQFDKDFDFASLIEKQTGDNRWGEFAQSLQGAGFERPRNGRKNDKAHPPIHPTGYANNLEGEEKKVYELVTRRFLACCSKNAKGLQTTVALDMSGERFTATGLTITERNYLDVYPYDKWNGNLLPDFQVGEAFIPTVFEIRDGHTTAPSLLTEADLVGLMDRNGVGTDATIAEHISKVIDREYVMKRREGNTELLVPSTLGIGLVEGYNGIGLDRSLTKPFLRQMTEIRMTDVSEGRKTKADFVEETLEEFREVYVTTRQRFPAVITSVSRYLEGAGAAGSDDDDDAGGGGGGGGGGPGGGRGRGRGRGRGAPAARGRGGRGGGHGGARHRSADEGSDTDDDGRGPGGGAVRGGRGGAPGRGAPARGRGGAAGVKRNDPWGSERDVKRHRDDSQGVGDDPVCQCNPPQPATKRTVQKDGPTKGRQFWSCPNPKESACKLFEWADADGGGGGGGGGARQGTSRAGSQQPAMRMRPQSGNGDDQGSMGAPKCGCGDYASEFTVRKEGPNQGKVFYKCAKREGEPSRCDFFEWGDGSSKQGGGGGGGGKAPLANSGAGNRKTNARLDMPNEDIRCDCDLTAVMKTTTKEGPNEGRRFFKCASISASAQCKFFAWEDELDNPAPPRVAGGGASNNACYKCEQTGHFASACPNGGSRGGGGAGGSRGGGGGGGAGSGNCFKCEQPGHWSSNCPNVGGSGGVGGGGRGGGASGGGGGSSFSCYKCGEQGHFSNACPNSTAGGGGGGYSSRGRGRGRGRGGGSRGGRGGGAKKPRAPKKKGWKRPGGYSDEEMESD